MVPPGLPRYLLKRLLLLLPTLFGITLAVFALVQFVPGGPIDQYRMNLMAAGGGEAGRGGSGGLGSSTQIAERHLAALKAYYGFDRPVHEQFARYVTNLFRGDLGNSFRYSKPVTEVISARLPISIYYGLVTTILTYAICIPLGMVKAIRHRTWFDNTTSVLIFLGYAVPNFALGALLLVFFSVRNQWFPLGGFQSPNAAELPPLARALDIINHSILPLVCYMVGSFAVMTMLMKNSLMENMSADYVKTALASGLGWRRAVFVHATRNSLIPLATSFGGNIGLILTGSVLIEKVFNLPGIGLLFLESVQARDFPVAMGLTIIGAALLLVGNLLSDICVAMVDPRVRFE
jgi:microcin C transport system permease protein